MPGWHEIGVTAGSPPEVRPGDVVELQVYDDDGKKQGTILVGTLRIAGEHRGGQVIEGMFLGAEDLYYHWWMNDGDGSPDKDKGFYHLCSTKVGKCSRGTKFPKMIHSDRYRIHRGTPLTAKDVPWLSDKIIREGYEFCRKKFDGVIQLPASKSKASKAEGKTAAKAAWAGEGPGGDEAGSQGEEEGEEESPEATSEDEGMRAKIEDLRKQLKRAEEEAAGKKKARAATRGKKKGRSKDQKKTTLLKAKKEASSTPKKRKKKKKRKEKGDPAPKGTGEGGSKQKRKKSTGEGSGKSNAEHRAKKSRVDDKEELDDSYYEYETEEDEEKEKLFESRPLEGATGDVEPSKQKVTEVSAEALPLSSFVVLSASSRRRQSQRPSVKAGPGSLAAAQRSLFVESRPSMRTSDLPPEQDSDQEDRMIFERRHSPERWLQLVTTRWQMADATADATDWNSPGPLARWIPLVPARRSALKICTLLIAPRRSTGLALEVSESQRSLLAAQSQGAGAAR
eukprot:Skav226050  [mRNA]  locus=scaffold211:145453:157055:+ [translate_table: standard]